MGNGGAPGRGLASDDFEVGMSTIACGMASSKARLRFKSACSHPAASVTA